MYSVKGDKHHKSKVVLPSNTVIQPLTMMIKLIDTLITLAAMFGFIADCCFAYPTRKRQPIVDLISDAKGIDTIDLVPSYYEKEKHN